MIKEDFPPDVAIVGGGVSGLALATELKRQGLSNVVVLERENTAGGVPRHCGHHPFGVREMKRVLKGPQYARRLVQNAQVAGVDIRTDTTVTALHPSGRLSLASAGSLHELQAKRVVLCTGVRESSRAQRFISGQRPMGVITTGALQSMVYLHAQRPFKNPVIIGTELVSFSAIMTCRHMGISPLAMIEQNSRVTVRQIMRPYPALFGIPIRFGATDLRILGNETVEAVEYTDAAGKMHHIETDGVIITGDFRPESALLHACHIDVDAATGGPSIDQYGRTSDPSYFSTGNLLRPVETSSWCWHEAVECAGRIVRDLQNPIGECASVPLISSDPAIRYVIPQRLSLSDQPGAMKTMQLRLSQHTSGYLSAQSCNKTLWADFIESRPERRIEAPLAPLLNSKPSKAIELTILGRI